MTTGQRVVSRCSTNHVVLLVAVVISMTLRLVSCFKWALTLSRLAFLRLRITQVLCESDTCGAYLHVSVLSSFDVTRQFDVRSDDTWFRPMRVVLLRQKEYSLLLEGHEFRFVTWNFAGE